MPSQDTLSFENSGGIPSPFDYRNVPNEMVASSVPLPEDFRLDVNPFPVWNQKKNGSCVGHALAKLAQIYFYKKTGRVINFSPRFLYAMAKAQDGFAGEGTYPSLVAKIMKNVGCATEETCPNDSDLPHEEYVYHRDINQIPEAAKLEAAQYRIPGYAFVNVSNPEDIKRAIFDGAAIAGLYRIGKEWWSDEQGSTWDPNRILPLKPPAQIVSGHEVVLYGWTDNNFHDLLNSWSIDWAQNGKGYLDYSKYKPFFNEAIVIRELPPPVIEEVQKLPVKPKYTFKRNLSFGETHPDIVLLQWVLKYEGLFPAATPSTGYYGEITRKAVLAFQMKYKIAPWTWLTSRGRYAHEATRAKLNTLYS